MWPCTKMDKYEVCMYANFDSKEKGFACILGKKITQQAYGVCSFFQLCLDLDMNNLYFAVKVNAA